MKLTRFFVILAATTFLWMWGIASTRTDSVEWTPPQVSMAAAAAPAPVPEPVLRTVEETVSRPREVPEVEAERPSIFDFLVLKAVGCSAPEYADPALFYQILDIEESYGVPDELRGMVLAAACNESSMNPYAEGDHKRAVGFLQLWPWWERAYEVDRRDPVASAHAWLKHIKSQLPKVHARCRPKSEEQAWKQAWVTAVRAPHPTGVRCREVRSLRHLWRLRLWMQDWNST